MLRKLFIRSVLLLALPLLATGRPTTPTAGAHHRALPARRHQRRHGAAWWPTS